VFDEIDLVWSLRRVWLEEIVTEEEKREFAEKLVRSVDPSFSIDWSGTPKGYTWDGSGRLEVTTTHFPQALHDVAHVLLASKRRLRVPEFGLGDDPSNGSYMIRAPMTVSNEYAQREEEVVCRLHIALVAYLEGGAKALVIADFLSSPLPPPRSVRAFARTLPVLPSDFVPGAFAALTVSREMDLASMRFRFRRGNRRKTPYV